MFLKTFLVLFISFLIASDKKENAKNPTNTNINILTEFVKHFEDALQAEIDLRRQEAAQNIANPQQHITNKPTCSSSMNTTKRNKSGSDHELPLNSNKRLVTFHQKQKRDLALNSYRQWKKDNEGSTKRTTTPQQHNTNNPTSSCSMNTQKTNKSGRVFQFPEDGTEIFAKLKERIDRYVVSSSSDDSNSDENSSEDDENTSQDDENEGSIRITGQCTIL